MLNQNLAKDEHDMKSAISALISGIELVKDEWKTNPQLVERILPLMKEKIAEVQDELLKYHSESN